MSELPDFLDRLLGMTPMDTLAELERHPLPAPCAPPEPPFTPPPGWRLELRSYCAGHGDTRSHWVVVEENDAGA